MALRAVRTFVCGLLAPGLGYWVVNKPRNGLITAALCIALVLGFSWARLIVDSVGYVSLIACLVAVLTGAALHSAFIESRGVEGARRWRNVVLFAAGVGIFWAALISFRGTVLGYEAYEVPSRSMAPTILLGDYIVVDTWRYKNADPANGEIVAFLAPATGVTYVKRIVGAPGDTVALQGNKLTRNDVVIDEPYAIYSGSGEALQPFSEVLVSSDEYLVLGDNRNLSKDSRHFGLVPRGNVIGVVAFSL